MTAEPLRGDPRLNPWFNIGWFGGEKMSKLQRLQGEGVSQRGSFGLFPAAKLRFSTA